eukprot:11910580-Alexandrium_andersonii.AAC.1
MAPMRKHRSSSVLPLKTHASKAHTMQTRFVLVLPKQKGCLGRARVAELAQNAGSSRESSGSRGMRNLSCALVWSCDAWAISVFVIALAERRQFCF